LSLVLDHALLEDQRVGRVDDHQPLQAIGMLQRRRPGDRAAPIVADEGEASDPERVGEREQVLDDARGFIGFQLLRPVGAGKAALIGATTRKSAASALS
jgi:hypothetical protein